MADVHQMMAAYAEDAVEYGKKLGKKLDFSEGSIEQVEEMCSTLYNAIPKGFIARMMKKSPPEEMIIHVAKILGGYIGEVLIRHHGGKWAIENFPNEGNTIILVTGDSRIFPVGKVYKRLKNGSEDNVHHYYKWLLQQIGKSF